MGDETAALYGKQKLFRSIFPPGFESGIGGKMIEAVVDLDGIEMLRVKGEHVLSRKLLWVKDAEPVFVIPSGCSDVNLPHHDLSNYSC